MIERLFLKIRQRFCRHRFRKRYNHKIGNYEIRCTKCGKVKEK